MMLRITTNETQGSLFVQLEGKLAGPWVGELEQCLRAHERSEDSRALHLNLAGVTFVDDRGKELLRDLHRRGAELTASGCLMRAIVAELANDPRK
jgi:hypothetical protein